MHSIELPNLFHVWLVLDHVQPLSEVLDEAVAIAAGLSLAGGALGTVIASLLARSAWDGFRIGAGFVLCSVLICYAMFYVVVY
ncbi:MAG: hypothetical protein OXD50_01850 [Chloroflexi bacterium]|nr:hypothetical protein [Chloroflexota bacterium]